MKGQALNLDWTVGLSLFLLTLLTGTFTVVTQDFTEEVGGQRKSALVDSELQDEASIKARKTHLYVRGPVETGKIPVDRSYVFSDEAYAGSGVMEIPARVSITEEEIITVTGTGNTTSSMTYFFSNVSNRTYSNTISIDNSTGLIDNGEISLNTGSPGLTSLSVGGNELLNDTAKLEGGNFTVTEQELHAYSLNGTFKVYNGSREIIFERGNGTFYLKNLSELYWPGQGTEKLAEAKTYQDGETEGFTVASDYGITFTGKNLNAEVKIENGRVVADVNSTRLRIFLHDSDYTAGRKRINFSRDGDIFFGAEKPLEGVWEGNLDSLSELNEREFENRLDIDDWEYNITLKTLERGARIPFQDVFVRKSRAAEILRNGSFNSIESKVAVWR